MRRRDGAPPRVGRQMCRDKFEYHGSEAGIVPERSSFVRAVRLELIDEALGAELAGLVRGTFAMNLGTTDLRCVRGVQNTVRWV